MPILDRIRDAYLRNPAEALGMIPELLKAYDDGWVVELPCTIIAARGAGHRTRKNSALNSHESEAEP